MLNREAIIDRVTAIAERVAATGGLEVVEVELHGGGKDRTLRIFIDRPPSGGGTVPVGQPFGVTLEDCEQVSHQVEGILDAEDLIPDGAYKLEVSSPGVERKLLRPIDYQRFEGHRAKIRLREPLGKQKVVEGVLKGIRDNIVTIDPDRGEALSIPISQIERANLKFVW